MMAEYIDKQKALDAMCAGCNEDFGNKPCEPSYCSLRLRVNALHAADVVDRQTYNNALDMANRMADKIKAIMDIVGVRR